MTTPELLDSLAKDIHAGTQDELATHLGVSQGWVSRLLRGHGDLDVPTLARIYRISFWLEGDRAAERVHDYLMERGK